MRRSAVSDLQAGLFPAPQARRASVGRLRDLCCGSQNQFFKACVFNKMKKTKRKETELANSIKKKTNLEHTLGSVLLKILDCSGSVS